MASTTSKEFSDILLLKNSTEKPLGLDVSAHQEEIDWKSVADFGIKWVYIKSTEGAYHKDPSFLRHWKGAKDAGLLTSAYHYAILFWEGKPSSPEKEAKSLLATVPKDYDLPLALDLEPKEVKPIVEAKGRAAGADWIKRFIRVVEEETGVSPCLYTHHRIMGDEILGKDADEFKIYHTWWAYYVNRLESVIDGVHKRPKGWGWNMWQFTSNGIIPGISSPVDVNIYNGSLTEFEMWSKTWKIGSST